MSGFKQVSKAEARGHMARDERIARLEGTVLDLDSRSDYVQEISRLWQDAQNTFLTIGRYLVKAAANLEHGEYQAMVDNELPFGYQVSYQLRKVAEAIDGQRIFLEELPPSYATIYQITTLEDPELDEARKINPPLLRPTVKRSEIVAFKRELAKKKASSIPLSGKRTTQLQRRQKVLIERRAEIDQELADIELELAKIERRPLANQTRSEYRPVVSTRTPARSMSCSWI